MSFGQQQAQKITPKTLSNLNPTDALRLCQYISALEQENRTKNEEQICMQKYMQSMQRDMDDMMDKQRDRRTKEEAFRTEIMRLSEDNLVTMEIVKNRQQKILQLQALLQNLQQQFHALQQMHNQTVQSHQKTLQKLHSESKHTILQMQSSRSQQFAKIVSLNAELEKKSNKYEELYRETVEKLARMEQKVQSLQKQLRATTGRLSEIDTLSQRAERYQQQIIALKNKEKQNQLSIQSLTQNLANKQAEVAQLQSKLIQVEQIHSKQYNLFQQKQSNLQSLLTYIKSTILQMQSTIQNQNKQIQVLRESNTKLRGQILENITNMGKDQQTRKDHELEALRKELAGWKGRFAQLQRKFKEIDRQRQREKDREKDRDCFSLRDQYMFRPMWKDRIERSRAQLTVTNKQIQKNEIDEDEKRSKRSGTFSQRDKYNKHSDGNNSNINVSNVSQTFNNRYRVENETKLESANNGDNNANKNIKTVGGRKQFGSQNFSNKR